MRILVGIVLVLFAIGWFGYWFWVGICTEMEAPQKIEKTELTSDRPVLPVDFINHVKASNHRLPTKQEFYAWEHPRYNDYPRGSDSLIWGSEVQYIRDTSDAHNKIVFRNVEWSDNFFGLIVNMGDYRYYYRSDTDSYYEDNEPMISISKDFYLYVILGFLPVIVLGIYYLRNNRNRKQFGK
ncbi:MAG: hypothetical protein M0D57_01600 [Sphingobacteriales bacterium JAD_PAG50586_3]|nr:MAG: hypothetical protein M0D57_01600 [Sphingobacteriales bacterium JAD_PAG50586_3]